MSITEDPLLLQVLDYLTKFDFPLAYLIQKKFCRGRYYLHLMIY